MNTGVVSRRFAKALLDYATSNQNEEKVYGEAKVLAKNFFLLPDLMKAINNPMIAKDKKLNLLKEAAGGKNVSENLMRFFDLVLKSRREQFLQLMVWSYIHLYREAKHIKKGTLTTAVPSEKLVAHLEQQASIDTNSTVELDAIIDPNIIGGFIIELDGIRMNASIANQLNRIKQEFINKNRRIV